MAIVERLGVNNLNYCAPCISSFAFQNTGNQNATKDDIIQYLCVLSSAIEQIPRQGYGENKDDLRFLNPNQCFAIIQILKTKPTVERVKQLFGSWLKALIASGILDNGTRPTSRGTQCIAKDGHTCLSLSEKTIDDYLFNHNIEHRKEPHYPNSNLRADFEVNGVFIEYFGLKGEPFYDAKILTKTNACKEYGIELVALYAKDLASVGMLEEKLNTAIIRSNLKNSPLIADFPKDKEQA